MVKRVRKEAEPSPKAQVLIVEVYPNGFAGDGSDQFVRLHNPTEMAVDLAGWSIGDGKVRATFPARSEIGAGQSLYLARDSSGFAQVLDMQPDYVWAGQARDQTGQLKGGASLRFGKESGVVVLRTADDKVADMVAYGAKPPKSLRGWKGEPVRSPMPGEVLDRARDEATWTEQAPGDYDRDSNSAADWKQGNFWLDGRVYRPGQTWFAYPTYQVERVTAYASPDSAYPVLKDLIDGAQESIDINLYDFTLVPMARALAAAAERGVKVRLMLEAGSVKQLYDQERWTAMTVHQAGGEVRWIVNDPKEGFRGRYVFNHAKYGVIDGRRTFVQSENMVRHGVPTDPSFGNRGWGCVVESVELADYLARVFESDWTAEYGDIAEYKPGTLFGPPPDDYVPEEGVPVGEYPHPFDPLTVEDVAVTPVLAPEHALLSTKGLIGLMRGAQQSILVEQQYAHLHWGPNSGSPDTTPDLFLDECIQAARRGLKVRILLGDAYLNPKDPKDNTNTVKYLNELAGREELDLQARIVRSDLAEIDKIHNKGIIVDGEKVFVSSINWSYNSPANNREVGLILDHPDLASYFTDVFTYDWFNGSPAEHPLITEIDAANEFIELTHFGPEPLEIGGWTLTTAAGPLTIPAGAILVHGQPLVLARDAQRLHERFDTGAATVVEMPSLALRGGGEVLKLTRGDEVVDCMAWGGAQAGWGLGAAACRLDAGKDTNTALDWTDSAQPTPGKPGCGDD